MKFLALLALALTPCMLAAAEPNGPNDPQASQAVRTGWLHPTASEPRRLHHHQHERRRDPDHLHHSASRRSQKSKSENSNQRVERRRLGLRHAPQQLPGHDRNSTSFQPPGPHVRGRSRHRRHRRRQGRGSQRRPHRNQSAPPRRIRTPRRLGHAGSIEASAFNISKGGLFRSFTQKGAGKYRLHAHVATGEIDLPGPI